MNPTSANFKRRSTLLNCIRTHGAVQVDETIFHCPVCDKPEPNWAEILAPEEEAAE